MIQVLFIYYNDKIGEVAPTELTAIDTMFMLLCTICKFQPTFITQLLVNKIDSTYLETIFGILASTVPTSLKAQILTLLSIWMNSDEGITNSSLLWAHLEASQIVPTLSMDSQLVSSSLLDDVIKIPLSPSLGGVVHELMQVEAPVGVYPVTISLLRLLSNLLRQKEKDEKLVKSIVSSLGLGSRKCPGIWPYLKLVLSGCLIPICTGPIYHLAFLDNEEKLTMVQESVYIITSILKLSIIQDLPNIISSCGIFGVFLGIGTIHGEMLGLPSLNFWKTSSENDTSVFIKKSSQEPSIMANGVLQFIHTLMDLSKNSTTSKLSQFGYLEEMIIINRPQFLMVLAQIISTSNSLELVYTCVLLLKDLLSIPRIDSILRSVLGLSGMEQFSLGISRWFGNILIEESDNVSSNIEQQIYSIQTSLLELLSSQVHFPLGSSSMPSSVLLKTNTTSLLLGLHNQEEPSSKLLNSLVSNILDGNFCSSFLLYSIAKIWRKSNMLKNANAIPTTILLAIDTHLSNIFLNYEHALPSSLCQLGDTLHLVAWITRDSMGADDSISRSEVIIKNIFSKLLSIIPSTSILSLEDANDSKGDINPYQSVQVFLEGHAHAISGIALLLTEPSLPFVDLIIDALIERGNSWSQGIINTLCSMLSRGIFDAGSFIKLCSLFPILAPKGTSGYALGCVFSALNQSLVKESLSIRLSVNICECIGQTIVASLSMENGSASCRLLISILIDRREIPSVDQLASTLVSILSVSFKLEELIRVSLARSEEVVYLELISCLFYVFKNNPQALTIFVQLISISQYPSHIHHIITTMSSSTQYVPAIEIAFGLIENSTLAGASVAATLRTCIGQLLPIPLHELPKSIKEASSIYPLVLSIRMATLIIQNIALSNQRTSIEMKIINSIHSKCVRLFSWLSASFQSFTTTDTSINRSELLELVVVLLNYLLSFHGVLNYFDSSSFKEYITASGNFT